MTQTPDLLMETPSFDDAAPGPAGIAVLSDTLRVYHGADAILKALVFGLTSLAMGGALVAAPVALASMFPTLKADATPYFARQTGRNCNFCHRGAPRLNHTGLIFKNNGFLFPDSSKAPDKDHKDTPAP